MTDLQTAVVFGSGSMGSGIAALLASTGVKVHLLDMPADGPDRNARARAAVDLQLKRGGFFHKKFAANITVGNSEDDLAVVADAQWVIEAIFENLDAKRSLYAAIAPFLGPDTVLSSNTSTIPLAKLSAELAQEHRSNFFITHFFNPPRVMPLVEVVAATSDAPLMGWLIDVIERQLGKSVLICRDTPGFIANRIGNFWMAVAARIALDSGIDPEYADAVFSKPFGIPRTGVFGLFDYIGLQLVPDVWRSLHNTLPATDALQKYNVVEHPLFTGLIERGLTGRTGDSGFYNGPDQVIDSTFEYRPKRQVTIPTDLIQLVTSNDYARQVFVETLRYCCDHAHDIANTIADIDAGMELGYSWQRGPFALADAIGVDTIVSLFDDNPPSLLLEAVAAGGFYQAFSSDSPAKAESGEVLATSPAATLTRLPSGIGVLTITTKLGIITTDVLAALNTAAESDLRGLVITSNDPKAFSAGAELSSLVTGGKGFIDIGVSVYRKLQFAPFPVVAAVHGITLGGGAELMLHADTVVAHVDTKLGFPERSVGIFPGWGGVVQHLIRHLEAGTKNPHQAVFDFAMSAARLQTAFDAQDNCLLRPSDRIVASRKHLRDMAIQVATELAADYRPPVEQSIPLYQGQPLNRAVTGEVADVKVGQCLAQLLTGDGELAETEFSKKSTELAFEAISNPANAERAKAVATGIKRS
ncbi:3-hydroxyacyl-CoA dehydrogenase [Corynebacterium mustelae]|uniref:3-hydroxyacyl-CoA dehydrogenase n=1 Tax=Corynebacterium mustelae TaxID=571915 RepID=A0A0G3GZY4_9CORY|nr:3-hydroxyacyl-CoA dehydrogenase/enoyl-CoA hydratase family protein [Corynebacterium mustelae]AKK06709.1 3-hydroxyacyl-CoA dehydrogenase [Corynebacterium mustelae]